MLKNLYARAVLWLIRPALELRHEQSRASSQELAAELSKIETRLSTGQLRAVAGLDLIEMKLPSPHRG